MKNSFLVIVFLSIATLVYAQKNDTPWSLQQCIEYALKNNITLKQAQLNTDLAKANYTQSAFNFAPTLNGFATHTYNFGQTIDRYTNQFATQRVQSNNFALSSNVNLFNGLQNYNTRRSSEANYESTVKDEEKTRNDVVLTIANSYLQVLFAQELALAAKNQVAITKLQVERTRKLVNAGAANKGVLLNIESQLANEELQVVNAENNVSILTLNLALMLNVEDPATFKIARPIVKIPQAESLVLDPGQVYTVAADKMPEVKGAELKLQGAEYSLSVARGAIYPTLSLNASIGTGYSGLRKDVTGYTYNGLAPTQYVTADGQVVYMPDVIIQTQTQAFGKQFANNVNKTVGLNLSVPFFNGYQTQTAIKRAKINYLNQRLILENVKIQLRKNIEQAYADALAAQKKYAATQKANEALKESFHYTEQRFEVGMVNSLDYNDAKNKLAKSDSDLLQAKYEYLFKTKILEFYQGKPLSLE